MPRVVGERLLTVVMKVKSSNIVLKNVRVHACHGVLPQERLTGGDFIVNLKVKCSIRRALQTDDVADTLNYAELNRIIEREMQMPSCLLEHVAGRIAEKLFQTFPGIEKVWVEVRKENPPMGADCKGAGVRAYFVR